MTTKLKTDPLIEPDPPVESEDTTAPVEPDNGPGWDGLASRVPVGSLAEICDGTGEPTGQYVLVLGYTTAGHPLVFDLPAGPGREVQNGVAAL